MKRNPSENIKLLIVDDKIDNVEILEAALEQEGLDIITTSTPKQVIDLCIGNNIGIALIDVKMPGLDGFELLDLIKQNPLTKDIIVVLITGYSTKSGDVVKGLNNGAADYLFKPLDLYITLAKVKSLITLIRHKREIVNQNIALENYQKKLFKAIEEKQKSKVFKENFLANMSHEIRTPLNGIIGLTALLKETSPNSDQLEIIELMQFSSKSLIGIVNDILESAQLDADKIKIERSEVNIINLIRKVCKTTEPLAVDKGLTLICDVGTDVPKMILADELRLNQILVNLINNAIKFTHYGSVCISLKTIKKNDSSAVLQFMIKDTGIGIPKSETSEIFNRFEQIGNRSWQKFGGTGLGLSIVKRLVELKGGELSVESIIGVGTTFTFTNTFSLAAEGSNHIEANNLLSDLPKFYDTLVLLADDNLTTHYIIKKMLKNWSIEVDAVTNGLEAFEKLKSKNYDLILMDTHMPIMDGIEATRKIREESNTSKNIPIISFSASVLPTEKAAAKLAGVDDFIAKPFDPCILNSKIRNLINKKKSIIS